MLLELVDERMRQQGQPIATLSPPLQVRSGEGYVMVFTERVANQSVHNSAPIEWTKSQPVDII